VWIAGVFGHIWLILRLIGKDKATLEKVKLPMEGLLGFGLTFAFLGTMLGGVWADQSWGRFWGWDPKENGALLIVLWTAVIYHARVGGLIREIGLAAGTVIGCIMVMVAWLGVNLLGVGLHSYGFTNAMATGFKSYILFEVFFLAVVLTGIKLRDQDGSKKSVKESAV
jgi:ABC-type transport system involved in cytochrome c biogenesis permease subunit